MVLGAIVVADVVREREGRCPTLLKTGKQYENGTTKWRRRNITDDEESTL